MSHKFRKDQLILLTGDSVTDCSRDRENTHSMGNGYASLIASFLGGSLADLNLRFINRGISGNRSEDLLQRWEEDCIQLNPDWISILIGVNDTWRRFDRGLLTTAAEFEGNLRQLLGRSKETNANLVLLEPFCLQCGVVTADWEEDLMPKIDVVRSLAVEFDALLVPLQSLFENTLSDVPANYWAEDGVHPSAAGHGFIAQAWLKVMGFNITG